MRFYSRYPNPKFATRAEKDDWIACDKAMRHFSKGERDIICRVYREDDSIGKVVNQIAKEVNIDRDVLWKLIRLVEIRIATKRGLLGGQL